MVRRALLAFVLMLGCLSAVALTAPADAAGCVALQAADVRYGAPNLTGQTAIGFAEADCYLLPGGSGATYGWVEPRPAVRVEFTDSNGVQACPRGQEICKLSGPAPYTARVLSEARFPYELNLLRLDGADACPAGAVPAFSESSPSMRIADAEPWLACRELELRAGRHLVHSFTDTGHWYLLSSNGEDACSLARDPALLAICTVPHAGTFRVVSRHLQDTTPGFEGKRFSVAFLGLGAPGCQPPMDTSWSSPAVSQPVNTYLQVDCHGMPGSPGDRIGVAGGFDPDPYPSNVVETEVVDAVGRLVCDGEADLAYGCVLQGSPPYRLISWARLASPFVPGEPYLLAARSVDPALDCPLVTSATPFNTPVSGLHQGTGCWRYDVAPGEEIRTVVGKVTPSGIYAGEERQGGVGALLGPDFVSRCYFGSCRSSTPGRHTIVTNLQGGEHVLGIYRWPDPSGCRPLATDFTTLRGGFDGAQMMCVRIDVPEGRAAGVVLATPGPDLLMARWYNADGVNICEGGFARVSTCTARGRGPYHVIIGDGQGHDFIVSAFDWTPPSVPPEECIDLPPGAPVEVRVTGEVPTICVLAGPSGEAEDISISRTAGSGRFQAIRIAGGGDCDDVLAFSVSAQHGCHGAYTSRATRRAIAIVGDGGAATLLVTRTAAAPPASTMTNLRRPTLHGKPWVGRFLAARPGLWSPANASFFYVWSVNGKRLSVPISKKKLKLLPRYVGKKVRVQVVAVKPGSAPAVAASKPVKVRRQPAR